MATSDFDDVLGARDCVELFGTNKRRAEIRYRRLARSVHPDMGGSEEAMARLNALWDEYKGRNGKTSPRLVEVMRNDTYAVFEENDGWLVVERATGGACKRGCDTDGLVPIIIDSPVQMLTLSGVKSIMQADGSHAAYVCSKPPDGTMVMLSSLADRLPGKVDPADLAWITKRVIFLEGALRTSGVIMDDPMSGLALDVRSHTLIVVAPWSVRTGDVGRTVVDDYLKLMTPMMGDDGKTKRIRRFIEGVIVDKVTWEGDLLGEFDDLCSELFGGLRFHEMVLKGHQ